MFSGDDASTMLEVMPARFSQLVAECAASSPDLPALLAEGRVLTYGSLWEATGEAVEIMTSRGVGPGDRVMMVGENGLQLVPLMLAASELDAWGVPLNARMAEREVAAIRDFTDCRLAIYCATDSPDAAQHGKQAGARLHEDILFGDLAIGATDPEARPEPVHEGNAEQTAVLVFTSGTTGEPKGVRMSHRGLIYMGSNMAQLRGINSADMLYNISPISHTIGLGAVLMTAFSVGACVELIGRFTPAHLASALAEERVSIVIAVPMAFRRMLEYSEENGASLKSAPLRMIATAGAVLDPGLKLRAEEGFGVPLGNSYGMTEMNPIARSKIGITDTEVGFPQPGTDFRIVRADGEDAAPGEQGEVWARGPGQMLGYYRNEEETARTFRPGGFIATGDIAVVDEAGMLRIVGRNKEVIDRSGFNVYPVEVESVLGLFPGVAVAAVLGRAIAGSEEVVAFVQPLPGHELSVDALMEWARERLTAYKRPNEIRLVQQMPIGPTGKIMKIRLKQMLADT